MTFHWNDPKRSALPPYFGWLSTPIWVFPDTVHLALSVQCRDPGLTPVFSVQNDEHPLGAVQRSGISKDHWHDLALKLMA